VLETPSSGGKSRATSKPAQPLTVTLLGSFEVRVGDRLLESSVWRLQKARSLLKLLALAAGHRLAREQILDLLWPDLEPESAANNLYQTLHSVRRILQTPDGAAEVRLQHGLLSLQPDGEISVDVDAFEAAARRARCSDDPDLYHAAIALYTGDLLPDDLYEDWAAWRREALRESYLGLLLEVARRHGSRGELRQAMDALRRAVQAERTLEEAHMELVRLYASTGQRARALRQYAVLREALAAELDAEPDETSRQIYATLLSGRSADTNATGGNEVPSEEPAGPRHNLPIPLTSFVGREREVVELRAMLDSARVLTLTGVGGAGKTRLAMRVGWDLVGSYRDGVWLVNLASLADPGLVPQTVAEVFELPEQAGRTFTEALVNHLRSRQALLILDNCEHVRDACARLSLALLTDCAELQILATSRYRLEVPGEMTALVHPLSIPQPEDSTAEEIVISEAARLFLERARFRQPGFSLNQQTVPGVVRICRQVDGIPLAVELAAGRVAALSVDQIADHLSNAPGFLASSSSGGEARHETLRAAIDWSYDLLASEERALFDHVSVFEGGWLLEHAEAMNGDGSTIDLLSRLVDKSLVVAEGMTGNEVRYRLLEPVRQYGREKLTDSGQEEEVRRRHAELFAEVAEAVEAELRGPNQGAWLRRLEVDHDNIRAALRWAEERDVAVGLRIAGRIWRFWSIRGYLDEGRSTLRRLLQQGRDDDSIPASVRARALNAAGALAFFQTDPGEAIESYEASLALRREIGDEEGISASLSNLGLVLKDRGEYERASALLEESAVLCRRTGNEAGLASALGNLGILSQERGQYEQALMLLEQSLAIYRARGDQGGVLRTLNNLGALAVEQKENRRARELLQESLAVAEELGAKRSQFVALVNLGQVAHSQGRNEEALDCCRRSLLLARELGEKAAIAQSLEGMAGSLAATKRESLAVTLLAAADALRTSTGTPQNPVEHARYEQLLDELRRTLGEEFSAARDAGWNAMTDDVIALALRIS
jgi:predicted ATPase/DNA-binding SARP family transcriptional activator